MGNFQRLSAFASRRRVESVLQTEAAECGLACLAMIGRYHGHEIDLAGLRRRFSTSLKGITLTRMLDIAQSLGMQTRALRGEIGSLSGIRLPCILHWDLNHFVVLESISAKGARILDPAFGASVISLAELGRHFTGVILELHPGSSFESIKDEQQVDIRRLFGNVHGLRGVMLQILGLALGIELVSLLLPLQMQVILDQVVVTRDSSLLLAVTIAFGVLVGVQAALTIARGWVVAWMGPSINSQWVNNLFSHLLRLPLDFFEKRHIGDIASRFTSVRAIQSTLTGSFVEAVIDGLMASLTLALLIAYSPVLTLLVGTFCAAYATLRWALYRMLWRLNEEQLVYGSKQQSEMIESVRGIQAIKLANKQAERSRRFTGAVWETAERDQKIQRATLSFGAASRAILGMQRILLAGLGGWLVLDGRFSIGAAVAFTVLSDQFCQKFFGLIDKVVEFRMLKLHAQRIADISLSEPDAEEVAEEALVASRPTRISVAGLGFRYAQGEPWILRDLSFSVEPGESVAIIGPSGCGKTTLAKILLGLLPPGEGKVEIGGLELARFGMGNYRQLVAAVMQDDQLFAGTIADNISFFDEAATLADIIDAANAAAIHDAIVAMPMGYESLVGDMGSALSGGQKQRIVLARALYRKPRILVLDEATSHLDLQCERLVGENIRTFQCTKVIIAHRPQTIASCDRVIDLSPVATNAASHSGPSPRPRATDSLSAVS
jgi:ATP-binding cassette subfamily B protein RaxB